jgi:Skp family chaperone for outer membrane proteins
MTVMAREAWTDERLDDLNKRVESVDRRMEIGFAEMREEFRAVRQETQNEFQAMRAEMAAQAEMLNRTIYRLFGGMLIAWVVGVIAIIAQT